MAEKELKVISQPRIAHELIEEGKDFLDMALGGYNEKAREVNKKQAIANLEAAIQLIRNL